MRVCVTNMHQLVSDWFYKYIKVRSTVAIMGVINSTCINGTRTSSIIKWYGRNVCIENAHINLMMMPNNGAWLPSVVTIFALTRALQYRHYTHRVLTEQKDQ